jgi:hypothetical protein
MNNEDFIHVKLLLSAKLLALFSISNLLQYYNELLYSCGVTFTTIYAGYNLYLLHKKNKTKQ